MATTDPQRDHYSHVDLRAQLKDVLAPVWSDIKEPVCRRNYSCSETCKKKKVPLFVLSVLGYWGCHNLIIKSKINQNELSISMIEIKANISDSVRIFLSTNLLHLAGV